MAKILAFQSFDQSEVDLNFISRTLVDVIYDPQWNFSYDGIVYPEVIALPHQDDGVDYLTLLGGRGFRLAPDYSVLDGRLEVIGTLGIDAYGEVVENWEMTRIDVPLRDFYEALLTFDRADDRALLARALRGNDLFDLSPEDDRAFGMGGADRMFGRGGDDWLEGGAGFDMLDGGLGDDLLLGEAGNDRLLGGGGADLLSGGVGDDRVLGGAGADRLSLDGGADLLDGGAGIDWLDHFGSTAIRVDLARTAEQATGMGRDTIRNIENVNAAAGNDILLGNGVQNRLIGNAGNDRLSGRAGNDLLAGGTGADILDGGYGADRLQGGGGADRLVGGRGIDRMSGGLGEDVFVFRSVLDSRAGAADVVTDFRHGIDLLDLSRIDADTGRGGNQAFHLADDNRLGDAGSIAVVHSRTETRVLLDDDGDGRADMVIRLAGQVDLDANDFIF